MQRPPFARRLPRVRGEAAVVNRLDEAPVLHVSWSPRGRAAGHQRRRVGRQRVDGPSRRRAQELRRQPRPRRDRPERRARRGARRDRPERQREEHPPPLREPSRADPGGPHLPRGRGDHRQGDGRVRRTPAHRDRLPAVQPLPAPDGDRQPDARRAEDQEDAATRRRETRTRAAGDVSAWWRRRTSTPISSRGASSSGWPSRGR